MRLAENSNGLLAFRPDVTTKMTVIHSAVTSKATISHALDQVEGADSGAGGQFA